MVKGCGARRVRVDNAVRALWGQEAKAVSCPSRLGVAACCQEVQLRLLLQLLRLWLLLLLLLLLLLRLLLRLLLLLLLQGP